ncbi:helix-turn-helix transcriptional regulator [Shewanella inventionis]|uniref:helix-turn-helix domain-containing protein n=1 Tax=Shewanella inventionis TaxID=1738770 RepID=UPI001CBB2290|nr:helix-turn-helix transcriptional regulator [Shewanella inventionis]UAL43978.1 helix-turn-helix transcriptional regulator [Shewanella inventionis]
MEQLTKHDTILWINHAITYFKSIDKTQKDMAKALGLEESRVSEMKSGSGVISTNLMTKIVEYCGSPRRNPGRYLEVELYNDIENFFNSFESTTANRFYRKLLALIKNEDLYLNFLDLISPHNLNYKTDKSPLCQDSCRLSFS